MFQFVANSVWIVCVWRSACLQSHPHIHGFGTQSICEWFGSQVCSNLYRSVQNIWWRNMHNLSDSALSLAMKYCILIWATHNHWSQLIITFRNLLICCWKNADKIDNNGFNVKNLIISDKAHCHLTGIVNKENCDCWAPSGDNPHIIHNNQCTIHIWLYGLVLLYGEFGLGKQQRLFFIVVVVVCPISIDKEK